MVDFSICPSPRCPPDFFLTDKEGGPFRVSFTFWVLLWDPSFMLKSYGGWVVVVVVVGGLQDFSVSPSPLGPNWVFDLGWTGLGLGLRGFWDKVLGTGLDNSTVDYHQIQGCGPWQCDAFLPN